MELIDPNNIQQVYPLNDIEEHDLEIHLRPIGLPYCKCKCKPEHQELGTELEVTGLIIVHNSFDGREGVEWANELLKQ